MAIRGMSVGSAALTGVLVTSVVLSACGLWALAGSSKGGSARADAPVVVEATQPKTGVIGDLASPVAAMVAESRAKSTAQKPTKKPRPKPTSKRAQPQRQQVIRIMPMGDSITKGAGDGMSSAWSTGYRRDLYNRLTAAGLRVDFVGSQRSGAIDPNHEGHSGWQIHQLSRNATRWVKAYRPDVVLLMVGTNDVNRRLDLAHAPARLGLLIDRILAARPGVQVMVATIPPRRPPSKRAAETAAYNRGVIQQVAMRWRAGKPVALVPMHVIQTRATDYRDSVHLNACGYRKISFVWYLYLRRSTMLNPKRQPWPTGVDPLRRHLC
jgi:lysophospholipase L1-like esterase